MVISFSISAGLAAVIVVSLVLFIAVTVHAVGDGLFDTGGYFGGLSLFIALTLYLIGWALPTLAMLLVWSFFR